MGNCYLSVDFVSFLKFRHKVNGSHLLIYAKRKILVDAIFFMILFSHPLISLPQAVHAVGVLCIVNEEVARVGI